MRKLFISYRSSDHREVDYIAKQLRSIKDENGNAKYTTWQDKHDLDAGKSWWDGIIEAIIDCDIFVFHLSPDYLASKVCIAELNYAVERNRPIVPVVLDSAYYLNPRTKKPDIDFWDDVPDWLGNYQFLFFNEENFLFRFERAVAKFEENWPQDIIVRPPMNPDDNSVHGSTFAVYASATDYAIRLAFDEAKPLFRELVTRNDTHFADICRQWLTLLDRYQELLDAKQHRAPRAVFKGLWDSYTEIFPLDFVDDLYPDATETIVVFDPKNLAKAPFWKKKKAQAPQVEDLKLQQVKQKELTPAPPETEQSIVTETPKLKHKTKPKTATMKTKPTSISLMPSPFDWIEIQTKDYSIAKYPVTNAQFAEFIKTGGYDTERWWTKDGWQQKQKESWAEPRYWNRSKWNSETKPVVGVSWYECLAFCRWLSEITGENIRLPTEEQWQYIAQGDDGRIYPWGNNWDCKLCNNSVTPCKNNATTPVNQYEGKGENSFGVVDMAGNVWEWCLTDYNETIGNIDSSANGCALRGGSWNDIHIDKFRCDVSYYRLPRYWYNVIGFRLLCY